jgi:hypothetical protein
MQRTCKDLFFQAAGVRAEEDKMDVCIKDEVKEFDVSN